MQTFPLLAHAVHFGMAWSQILPKFKHGWHLTNGSCCTAHGGPAPFVAGLRKDLEVIFPGLWDFWSPPIGKFAACSADEPSPVSCAWPTLVCRLAEKDVEGAAASRLCCRHRKLAIFTSKASSSPYPFKKSESKRPTGLRFPGFFPAIACWVWCLCLYFYSDSIPEDEEAGLFLLD